MFQKCQWCSLLSLKYLRLNAEWWGIISLCSSLLTMSQINEIFYKHGVIYISQGNSVRFLAHLIWKLKWGFLIAGCQSSVYPSVNFYIFDFFSRTAGPILTRLGTNHPWVKGIHVCSKKVDNPSPRGDDSKRVKIHWKFLKIFFRTSRPNWIKLRTNYH
jgi:hypothetical protein